MPLFSHLQRPPVRLSTALLLLLAGSACHHAPPVTSSGFTVVDPIGLPMAAPVDTSTMKISAAMSVIVPPQPIPPLTLPTYPAAALAARLRDIHVAVTIAIDREGKVTAIEPSIARLPYTTAFRDEFLAAVREAVASWRFEPGQLARLTPQADGTPLIGHLETVERELTLAFVFSHTGKVSSDFGPR